MTPWTPCPRSPEHADTPAPAAAQRPFSSSRFARAAVPPSGQETS
ncbi:hypothetical protein D516_3190 [Rhodobacter sp. AKP1]|nr:hypothetical protein D516_3190 [Rhodobacter sp. AKP1]